MSHATTSTPSIRVYDSAPHHNRYSLPRRSSYAASGVPMAIPNARESPPPPLPPPRYIGELAEGQDPGWQWGNTHSPNGAGFGRSAASVKPGSSLLGGGGGIGQVQHHRSDGDRYAYGHARRESASSRSFDVDMNTDSSDRSDEDRGPARPSLGNHRFTSESQLGKQTLQNSSHAYDKQLLSKIGGPNTPTRTSNSGLFSSSAQENSTVPHNTLNKLNGQLKPLSVPDRLYSSLDSPISRWTPSGGVSPGHSGFRSPGFDPSYDSTHPRRYGSLSTPSTVEESVSAHPRHQSFDVSVFSEQEFGMEDSGLRDLNINDRSPAGSDEYPGSKAGIKRRASSPPSEAARDDRPLTGGGNDLYHRRSAQMLVNRNSPVSRFHANQGSLSSASSLSQRTGSFASSYGLSVASSATSYNGGEQRLSPGALSPSVESEFGAVSPFTASRSLNPSPRASLSRPQHQRGPSDHEPHHRTMSDASLSHSRQNSGVQRIQGNLICECCPKKPKKFDTEDELRIHELEKQYTCAYCSNRFKNKNEAERHQNSLHLRRHSWSCAALSSVEGAFHPSSARPALADVCGYCGDEFPNPADWPARSEHLNHVHKFGECNQAKKFFRADHFRQHLKHSHAGTSGKWTNMLENACMKDEPPPKERVSSVGSLSGSSAGGLLASASKPGVIDEVHDES